MNRSLIAQMIGTIQNFALYFCLLLLPFIFFPLLTSRLRFVLQ